MPIPDAAVYHEASGEALHTVKAHQEEAPLKLYSGWFCPFVQRVWSVLEEKRIPYQYIEVNPYHKPESLLRLNPRGLVPTLEHDNRPLYESTVVMEFLEDAYPDHKPTFRPEDPHERARLRIWTDYVTSRIIPSFHRFLQFQPSSDTKGLDEKRQEFLAHLREWTAEMDEEGPYFAGKEPRLVDFQMAPWAVRLWVLDEMKGGLGIPPEGQGGEHEKLWARWRKWTKAMEARDSMKATWGGREHLRPLFQRYADDEAQSELAKATRAGRGVP